MNRNRRYDVCIIGAGAAGLAAAAALRPDLRICMIDKNQIPGRKILATGGGRCNLTNAACVRRDMTLDFFRSLGLETRCDSEGRYYPYSNAAADVAGILTDALQDRSVRWMMETEVTEAAADRDGGFTVTAVSEGRRTGVSADILILACGGKAAPQFGTTGDGYRIARSLGHEVTRTYPILTGIECGDHPALSGVRARGNVSLLKDGRRLDTRSGEIQFTRDGISGICVFDLTPLIRAEDGESPKEAMRRFQVELDLAPDFTQEEMERRQSGFGIVCRAVSDMIPAAELKRWRMQVRGVKGWRHAQCTAGGVRLDDIDPQTMESRICKGLYFAGEILDIQGPCGGFNLQNAWETGLLAARDISRGKGRK